MNIAASSYCSSLFGIYEMDSSGTVFYHRDAAGKSPDESAPTIIGRNYFDEIAGFQNVGEFQRRFKNFINDSHTSDNFNFSFYLHQQVLKGRVKLMRVRERQNDQSSDLIIVDIRQVLI